MCICFCFNRSVDGKARRYDIRFGKLFSDTVGRAFNIIVN